MRLNTFAQISGIIGLLLGSLVGLSGCGGSSYPGDVLKKEKQPDPPANFYIDVQDPMTLTEGHASQFPVKGTVPAPASPLLSVERLPDGATLTNGVLSWTPKFNDVSLTEDQDGFRSYNVRFTLKSSEDPTSFVQRTVLMFVRLDPTLRAR